jgi:two-component system, OmpR family, heavy metal sensor histidine kinase CusS
MLIIKNQKSYTAQVAANITKSHQIIELYRHVLLVSLVIMCLLSLALSIFITRRGLKPIYLLNKGIHNVDINNLNLNLNLDRWPKELQDTVNILNNLLQRIDSSFTRLSRFSSDLAHELRTPLNNMICQTQIILSKNRTLSEYQSTLTSNLEESQSMAILLDKILFIARAKTPSQELKVQQLNFSLETRKLYDYYGLLAIDKDIELFIKGSGHVYADLELFKRAVGNLLSNAIKYTLSGGSITCSITETKDQSIICISDSGIGISPKHLPYLFDRFYRSDDSRSKNIEGLGLGLAITKSIIELHGGEIEIKSKLGHGTTIYLQFPKT